MHTRSTETPDGKLQTTSKGASPCWATWMQADDSHAKGSFDKMVMAAASSDQGHFALQEGALCCHQIGSFTFECKFA